MPPGMPECCAPQRPHMGRNCDYPSAPIYEPMASRDLKLMRPFKFPWLWRGIGWLMLAVVAILLVAPRVPDPLDVAHADKIYHVAAFAMLAGWAALLFESSRALLLRGLMLAAFGAGMEGVQALLPWRSADLADFIANLSGVAIGLAFGFTPLAKGLWLVERRLVGGSTGEHS